MARLIAGPWPLPPVESRPAAGPGARSAATGDVMDPQCIESCPALVVVASELDCASLIEAGEALERLLLIVTKARLQYTFFSHPAELEEIGQCAMRQAPARQPQVVVRISNALVPALVNGDRRLKNRALKSWNQVDT